MIPNFLITGVQKAATSWIAVCLGEHPQIFIPERKEIFYFDKHYSRGLNWYEAQFSGWSGETAVGEATPNYLYEPNVPERIYNTLGNIKIISRLRHTVDMDYFYFLRFVRRGLIPQDADFKTEFEQDGQFALRTRGNYFEQIRRYSYYFPQEHHLIVFQEEMKARQSKTLQKCYALLEVDVNYRPKKMGELINPGDRVLLFHNYIYKIRKLLDKLPRNVRYKIVKRASKVQERMPELQKPPRLDLDLRRELYEKHYAADVRQLSEFIDVNISFWS